MMLVEGVNIEDEENVIGRRNMKEKKTEERRNMKRERKENLFFLL